MHNPFKDSHFLISFPPVKQNYKIPVAYHAKDYQGTTYPAAYPVTVNQNHSLQI